MSAHEPSRATAGIPLQAHVEELRRRCDATARLQGGSTYYQEELGIFRAYAGETGLFLSSAPNELSRTPDEEGNEHQVWFDEGKSTYLKATWPDFFGLLVIHRPHEEPKASPIAYLERWHLHNLIFGDEVTFLGAFQTAEGLRLIIQQPAIQGKPATDQEIARFFSESGWKKFIIDENTAYFDPERQIVVSDTHRGNLVLMPDGNLAPIDFRVQPIADSLLDTVTKRAKID
jgi:hypothetical protein